MTIRLNASSVVVGLAIGALAAGGITYAAANTGGTTINACQTKTTGALRILASGTCKATEVAVSWNSQGPQGDPGSQGIPGAQGVEGPRGPATFQDSQESLDAAGAVSGKTIYYPMGSYDATWNSVLSYRSYSLPANVRVFLRNAYGGQGATTYVRLYQRPCSNGIYGNVLSDFEATVITGQENTEIGSTGNGEGCLAVNFQDTSSRVLRLGFIRTS